MLHFFNHLQAGDAVPTATTSAEPKMSRSVGRGIPKQKDGMKAQGIVTFCSILNPLTATIRGSGYKFFVTLYHEPAARLEHYLQNGTVIRRGRLERYLQIGTVSRRAGFIHRPPV